MTPDLPHPFSAEGAMSALAWGLSPRDSMTPARTAESALQPGWRIELVSEVNRAFSAAVFLYFMNPGALPQARHETAPLAPGRCIHPRELQAGLPASRPFEFQAVVALQFHTRVEFRSEFVQQIAKPPGVGSRCAFEPESPHLHWDQTCSDQFTAV